MAKQTEVAAEAPAPVKSGGKKKLLIIVGGALLVLGIGGGAAWFFLGHKSEPHAEQAKAKHTLPPLFVTLEPFVVNLAGDAQHYLQVGIDLRVVDNSVSDQIKLHMPEIRNAVLLLLSSKTVEDLAGVEQKNRLRDEIRQAVNRPLGIHSPPPKPPAADAGAGVAAAEPAPASATAPDAQGTEPTEPAQMDSGVLEVLLTSFVIQ